MTARRGVFWPLLLIALGLIFLLQNFGFISGVSWLAVASLWPLLLVLIGLDIAFVQDERVRVSRPQALECLPRLVAQAAPLAAVQHNGGHRSAGARSPVAYTSSSR